MYWFLGTKITAHIKQMFRLRSCSENDTMCLSRACIFGARIRPCC
nr:MAG TPA: hypothetical protein [Caudoviricetes sp.]